jgi:hypothetical protein
MNQQLPPDVEYDLAIDSQVEKFLDLKQKLAYFLITASAVITGFVVKFVVDHLRVHQHFTTTGLETSFVIASALAGLGAAGCSLFNIHFEHRSHRLHLQYRYQRRTWVDLAEREQTHWEHLNDLAAYLLRAAFLCLFIEISLAVAFFVAVFA